MEGLIPFVYKALMQYKNGNQGHVSTWFSESPSYSYMRLAGDSGRFQVSDIQPFAPDYVFSTSSSSSSSSFKSPSATTTVQVVVSPGLQPPSYRFSRRRAK